MKTLFCMSLGVLLMSASSFAVETSIPKGAIKNGTLRSDQYLMHKVGYENGAHLQMDQPVILQVLGISQKINSKVNPSEIGKYSEGSGAVTNKQTTIEVNVIEGGKSTHCILVSKGVDDGGSDFMGYDSRDLGCSIQTDSSLTQITLSDYSANVGEQTDDMPVAGVELTMNSSKSGMFGTRKNSYTAFIRAD